MSTLIALELILILLLPIADKPVEKVDNVELRGGQNERN